MDISLGVPWGLRDNWSDEILVLGQLFPRLYPVVASPLTADLRAASTWAPERVSSQLQSEVILRESGPNA